LGSVAIPPIQLLSFHAPATTGIYTLSLHDALPILAVPAGGDGRQDHSMHTHRRCGPTLGWLGARLAGIKHRDGLFTRPTSDLVILLPAFEDFFAALMHHMPHLIVMAGHRFHNPRADLQARFLVPCGLLLKVVVSILIVVI